MLTVGLYGVIERRGEMTAHDQGLALVRDGRILASLELERVTGRKHDDRLALYFDDLLSPWVRPGEPLRIVQANSFLGARFETASGSLRILGPADLPLEARLVPSEVETAGWLRSHAVEAFTIPHELAHIGTCLAFYGPPPPGTLLVHVDGAASVSACSAWSWDGAALRCIESSWDLLKSAVNNFNDSPLSAAMLGLDLRREHLSMPGKLMGFARLGEPRDDVMAWLEEHGFFLGDHRRPGADLLTAVAGRFPHAPADDPTRVAIHHDLAACMQLWLEERVLAFVRRHQHATGARHLCYAGGAALNVHANTRIENEAGFDAVMIPPAPSDCGLALGAAAVASWLAGEPLERHGPYLTRLTPDEPARPPRSPSASIRTIAQRIANGDVVAGVLGRSEVGPRALGHRSLLARPDSVPLRRHLSGTMKQREWYRPVAPMMLPDVAAQCLDGLRPSSSLPRYMLGAWRLRPDWRAPFAGCVHADGSVRAQIVDPADPEQAPLAELLSLLLRDHGIHGVINTSLNTRGHAIVHDPVQAIEQARCVGAAELWMDA